MPRLALEEPTGKGVEAVRPIRDEIHKHIESLIAEIDAKAGGLSAMPGSNDAREAKAAHAENVIRPGRRPAPGLAVCRSSRRSRVAGARTPTRR
ncbi:hypothetical protein GCM10009574_066180 [Streptomyces asiaticus]|uniref:Uncharacterized protein n=2 Tax=Streptomyces rhizosphaericus TaxID=114699 RepID=A0ABN1PEJ1_9ACTN